MSSVRVRPNEAHHLPSLTYASPPSANTSSTQTQAGPSYESYSAQIASTPLQPPRPTRSRHFRPWSFSVRASRSDTEANGSKSPPVRADVPHGTAGQAASGSAGPSDVEGVLKSYDRLQVADQPPPVPERPRLTTPQRSSGKGRWSDSDDEDHEPDAYSWVDPSVVGSEQLRRTPLPRRQSYSEPPSPVGTASRTIRAASKQPVRIPPSPTQRPSRPGMISQADSYNMLLAYHKSTSSHSSHSHSVSPIISPFTSSDGVPSSIPNPEWHDLVDPSIREVLGSKEMKRQGLWWELIKGEVEYVRDLRVLCQGIIEPMRTHQPPLISPETRLHAFVNEVFSTIPDIFVLQEQMLERLLERQRLEWPIITSATDILLRTYLEGVDLYETYMKNFPFSETRVKRECRDNPMFASFLQEKNTPELTGRRDISVFLSRPVSRLPRVLLLLEAIDRHTVVDHPDHEEIPTVKSVLEAALKSTQPGIESAEAKISLWNVGEKLMFRRGEIIEVDIPEPKRTLVHSGYVFRRVRSETNWHGWQDLHAILMDNYFLLTRDEEQGGRHIVVSRPIHIDFLELISADGVPERRHDYINQVRRKHSGNLRDGPFFPDRLMYPFSIALRAGASSKTYTLCVSSQAAREQWKERIENAKALRRYDIESNRTFAIHTIYIPREIHLPGLMTADTLSWLGRETVVVGAGRSVWFGWRRDSQTYREIIRFSAPQTVTTVTIVPDFGWLLVVVSGALIAFNLRDIIPTHEPSTWSKATRSIGIELSSPELEVGLVRVGTTKGRLLVVHASYISRNNQTLLTFEEPLHASTADLRDPRSSFRRFAQLTVPGFASEVGFFRQTIAIVTEKTFIVAEPGNTSFNVIPVLPASISPNSRVARMTSQARPKAMFQIADNEFLLVYDWGGCFTTRYGEISRNGAFMRWNLTPSYVAFRPPHLLLFDEEGGRAEVRHASTGKVIEVVEWRGMKPLRLTRAEQGMLAISPDGLVEVVETVPL